MATKIVKLRKDGALNVPAGMRTMYGLEAGMTFGLEVSKEGLLYKRTYINCPVCGAKMEPSRQVKILDSQICSACDRKVGVILASGEATGISDAIRLLSRRSKKATARTK